MKRVIGTDPIKESVWELFQKHINSQSAFRLHKRGLHVNPRLGALTATQHYSNNRTESKQKPTQNQKLYET